MDRLLGTQVYLVGIRRVFVPVRGSAYEGIQGVSGGVRNIREQSEMQPSGAGCLQPCHLETAASQLLWYPS